MSMYSEASMLPRRILAAPQIFSVSFVTVNNLMAALSPNHFSEDGRLKSIQAVGYRPLELDLSIDIRKRFNNGSLLLYWRRIPAKLASHHEYRALGCRDPRDWRFRGPDQRPGAGHRSREAR